MELEVVHEVLGWVILGLMCGALTSFLIGVIGDHVSEKDHAPFFYATLIMLILTIPLMLMLGAVGIALEPECPNCGWEAVEEQASICPECGAEWDSKFCGDCGSQVMEGG